LTDYEWRTGRSWLVDREAGDLWEDEGVFHADGVRWLLVWDIAKKPGVSRLIYSDDNVLALGTEADFGAQNCQYTTKVDAR
jgi:hypothetical protein